MSKPIVVIVCMVRSSESWEPQQRPHPWHRCAGGGAVHSINNGQRPESRGSPDRRSGRGGYLPVMNALARGGVGTLRRYANGYQSRRVGGGKTILSHVSTC